eukprot:6456008-Amphidinium_carterae.1
MVRVPSREPVQGAFNHIGRRLSATSGNHLHRHLLCDEVAWPPRQGWTGEVSPLRPPPAA